MNLTNIQKEIISTSGNLIVRASAGTGKTFTMVQKISKEIDENKSHKVVAAITFTIKAAQEIKDRLTIDSFNHFIGTNNSFAIEEIIKPFAKDVFGEDFDIDMDTDYNIKMDSFDECLDYIRTNGIISSFRENKKNFVFQLAYKIITLSDACRKYIGAKYFKFYIDEYQDCDEDMHRFFMYICKNLKIDTFIVGDEKQSIYMWRGAYPQAFKNISNDPEFQNIFMVDNFRSCEQIQNYSNLLCLETRHLYKPLEIDNKVIIYNTNDKSLADCIHNELDISKSIALLRFRRNDAEDCSMFLNDSGYNFVYIPLLPISEITTSAAWLYDCIARYVVVEKYSVYDVISEIPVEGEESKKSTRQIEKCLNDIKNSTEDKDTFHQKIKFAFEYFDYSYDKINTDKLYETITNNKYYPAFDTDSYKHIAITFHSSKGLEFDQVIIFASDYDLNNESGLYNHYVAATRAKEKLVIINDGSYKSNCFFQKLNLILKTSSISIDDVCDVK